MAKEIGSSAVEFVEDGPVTKMVMRIGDWNEVGDCSFEREDSIPDVTYTFKCWDQDSVRSMYVEMPGGIVETNGQEENGKVVCDMSSGKECSVVSKEFFLLSWIFGLLE